MVPIEKRISDKLDELYNKPKTYQYNLRELNFIKKHNKRHNYDCYYVIYKKESKKPIGFVIDSFYNAPRPSGVMNSWEIIAKRSISDLEWEEECQNFGCNNRRFKVYWYKSITALIQDDLKYGIHTPKIFVDECVKRGFNNGFQTKLF